MDLSRLNHRQQAIAEEHLYFFAGTGDQCVLTWLEDIEIVAKMIRCDEFVCLQHGIDFLIWDAERYYQSTHSIFTSWPIFKQLMIAQFDRVAPTINATDHVPSNLPSSHIDTLHCTEVESHWPDGLISRVSEPFHAPSSSHHFHPQHERDYASMKSMLPYPSGSILGSTLLSDPLQSIEAASTWPAGLTSWCSEPLPQRSHPDFSGDNLPTSINSSSSISEQQVMVTFVSAACVVSPHTPPPPSTSQCPPFPFDRVSSRPLPCRRIKNRISSPRLFCSASLPTCFSRPRQTWQLFSTILLVLLSFFWCILTSAQFCLPLDACDAVYDVRPVRELWHLMVP